jgi:hypothetical protein
VSTRAQSENAERGVLFIETYTATREADTLAFFVHYRLPVRSGCFLLLTGRLKDPGRIVRCSRGLVSKPGTATASSTRESTTSKLAKFFPNATPLRIPVRLTRLSSASSTFSESTILEFGTAHEILFASTLPLEFADLLRVRNSDGSLDAEACVVALQYNGTQTAVAARFTEEVANWIVKA